MPNLEPSGLSERELEILLLVATGASNKEIAQKLFISSNTVKVHLRNIFAKIGAASRTEAAMYAVRIGLVHAPAQIPPEEPAPSQDSLPRSVPLPETEAPEPKRRAWPAWARVLMVVMVTTLAGLTFILGRSSNPPATPQPTSPPIIAATEAPRWHQLASLPTPRFNLALVAIENQLYAIGGESDQGISGNLERFDVQSNTWSELASKPIPVTDALAAVINGLIYVPGGRTGAALTQLTDQLEIYHPAEDRWTTGAPIPTPLSAYALVNYEGKLYLFGGWDGEDYLASVYMYDPVQDTWQERTPMPTARALSGAAEAGGLIYVIGGYAGEAPLDVNEVYYPARDSGGSAAPWASAFPLPDARQGFRLTTIADTIYVIGGTTPTSSRYGLIFIPSSNAWQSLEASPQPVGASFGLASLGTYLYLVGGEVEAEISSQNQAYQALITLSIPIIIK